MKTKITISLLGAVVVMGLMYANIPKTLDIPETVIDVKGVSVSMNGSRVKTIGRSSDSASYTINYQPTANRSVTNLINAEREKNGKREVQESSILDSEACRRAVDLYNANQWSHDGFLNYFDARIWDMVGENLGRIVSGEATDSYWVNAWMYSPTHKANILGNWKYHGYCEYNGYIVSFFGI